MGYVATVNTLGYMPFDDDPPVFDTAAEAWEYLAEELKRTEDDCDDGDDCYSATVAHLMAMRHSLVAGDASVYGETPGYVGSYDLGLVYSVSIEEWEE